MTVPAHVSAVWIAMADMFGPIWLTSCGETPEDNPTWLAGLSLLTPEQVLHGLGQLEGSGSEFPPSWPRFKALCMAFYTPGYALPAPRMPDFPGGRFKAMGNIMLMKAVTAALSAGRSGVDRTDHPALLELNALALDYIGVEGTAQPDPALTAAFRQAFADQVAPLV